MKEFVALLRRVAGRWKLWLPAVLAVLAAATGVLIVVTDDDGDNRPDRIAIEIPDSAPVQVDRDQQLEPKEQREADLGTSADSPPALTTPDVHEDARDETPPGVTPADVKTITEGHTAGVGDPRPVGGAQNLSCRWHPVRNYSSRNGAKVKLFVLHYTVSRPGSLDAIWRLFNTPSFAASSTYLLEGDGRCERLVSFANKPWTQGAFNPVSESVEIIAYGDETRAWWLSQPIFTKGLLAEMVRDRLRANGLPLRRVDPDGCAVQQAGWTDHDALECGNTHHDVKPTFPYDVLARQIRQGACRQSVRPRGDNCGKRVRLLKQRLQAAGYERVVPGNASYGKRAQRAVVAFKRSWELGASPVCGEHCFDRLKRPSPYVRPGTHNRKAARALKWELRQAGHARVVASNGIYGKRAQRALVTFKRRHGLGSSRTAGPKSWRGLRG